MSGAAEGFMPCWPAPVHLTAACNAAGGIIAVKPRTLAPPSVRAEPRALPLGLKPGVP